MKNEDLVVIDSSTTYVNINEIELVLILKNAAEEKKSFLKLRILNNNKNRNDNNNENDNQNHSLFSLVEENIIQDY